MSDEVIDAPPEAKAAEPAEKREYLAACRTEGDEPRRTLTLRMASGCLETFWYADLRNLAYEVYPGYGRNPKGGYNRVLRLRFWDGQVADLIMEGDNLFPLYDDLRQHRIAWLAAILADDEPPAEGATVIRKIYIDKW